MRLIAFYVQYGLRFLGYYFRAATRYDIHSPFVAEFVREVLEEQRWYYPFSDIEHIRQELKRSRRIIPVSDYGAGSRVHRAGASRSVGSIARFAAAGPAAGRRLFHLVRHYRPRQVLELGTSLGIGTLYLSAAASTTRVTTVEGCAAIAALAREHLVHFGRSNIDSRVGPFEECLPDVLEGMETLDLLYLDGDHRRDASLRYVQQCMAKAGPDSVFVIADIYWSKEMTAAWKILRNHPRVRLSIDLFDMGLLFFRKSTPHPEHYTLIRSKWKPWRIGLFPRIEPSPGGNEGR